MVWAGEHFPTVTNFFYMGEMLPWLTLQLTSSALALSAVAAAGGIPPYPVFMLLGEQLRIAFPHVALCLCRCTALCPPSLAFRLHTARADSQYSTLDAVSCLIDRWFGRRGTSKRGYRCLALSLTNKIEVGQYTRCHQITAPTLQFYWSGFLAGLIYLPISGGCY